jgi:hypothetical protein
VPPLPNALQVLKVSLKLTDAADLDIVQRLFFHYTGPAPTVAQLVAFATSVEGAWAGNLAQLHTVDKALVLTTVEDLTSPTGAVGQFASLAPGSYAGSALPAGVAVMTNWAIARRYRGGKPRTYWPMGRQADVATPQTWSGAFISAVQTDLALFIAAVKALTWAGATIDNQVNVSFYSGFTTTGGGAVRAKNHSTPRVGNAVVDIISGFGVNGRFASQRRRNRP